MPGTASAACLMRIHLGPLPSPLYHTGLAHARGRLRALPLHTTTFCLDIYRCAMQQGKEPGTYIRQVPRAANSGAPVKAKKTLKKKWKEKEEARSALLPLSHRHLRTCCTPPHHYLTARGSPPPPALRATRTTHLLAPAQHRRAALATAAT